MNDETAEALQATAEALQTTAETLRTTAETLQTTVGALPTPPPPPPPPPVEPPRTWFGIGTQLLLVAIAGAIVFVIWVLPPPPPGTTYTGIADGLVFARCDRPPLGTFRQSVELWGVDAARGTVHKGGHAAVELPAHGRLAYPCDAVGGLTRRLFDQDFRHTVVNVRTPATGAEHVHRVDLADGRHRRLTATPDAAYSPHPHNGLAVFGPSGQTVWYRSSEDSAVHAVDPATGRAGRATAIDGRAVAFAVASERSGEVVVQGDPTAEHYADDLALPNPEGDLAAGDGMLYVLDSQRAVRLACADLLAGDPTTGCAHDGVADGTIRPAAWLDDRTLLAISGPRRGANTLLRIEIAGDGRLRACPAIATSDWSYRGAAVGPDDRFAADAVRDGVRMLFLQPTGDAGTGDLEMVERPAVPDNAHMVTWQGNGTGDGPVAHVCGADT